MHQPGNLLFQDRGKPMDYGKILPSFTLEYHPSDKFHLEVGFHSIDPYMYHLYGRDERWSPDEYWNYGVRKKH
jgi:hypothetical protein